MLNHIVMMGRLTRDPELRHTQAGTAVASFTVAVDRDFKDKETGERKTDFIDCVAWDKRAEFVSKYFLKGDPIEVNGVLTTRTYDDRDGKKRKVVEVNSDRISFPKQKKQRSDSEPEAGESQGFEELEGDDSTLPF